MTTTLDKGKGDVKILGAGVAGLSTAILLKKRGYFPIVYEKKNKVGGFFKRSVTGVLNYNSYFEDDLIHFLKAEVGLKISKSFHSISKLTRFAPNGSSYTVNNNDNPIIYNFLRGSDKDSLETELLIQSNKLKIPIIYDSKIKGNECEILANGTKMKTFIGYGIHIKYTENKDLAIDPNEVKVFFNNEFAPRGYGYILPYGNNEATISIFTLRNSLSSPVQIYFNIFLNYLLTNKFLPKTYEVLSTDSGYGGYRLLNNYIEGRNILVGSRAGLMTADYGFSLKESLVSSHIVANNYPNHERINREIKRKLHPYLKESILKRLIMNRLKNEDYNNKIMNKKNKEFKHKKLSSISKISNSVLLFIIKFFNKNIYGET